MSKQKILTAVQGALSDDESRDAASVDSKYSVGDGALVEDIMRLLKSGGTGIISRANIFRLRLRVRRKEIAAEDLKVIEERVRFLRTLRRLRLFGRFLKAVKSNSLSEALDKLVALIRAAYRKDAEKPMGQPPAQTPVAQMAAGVAFVAALLAPTTAAAMAARMIQQGGAGAALGAFLNGMAAAQASADGGDGAGKQDRFDATFTGTTPLKMLTDVVDRLTDAELEIFKIARVMDTSLTRGKQEEEDSPVQSEDTKMRNMKAVAEVTHAVPSALAQPASVLAYRMATKQVVVRQEMKLSDKKQLFYVLVDSSGSMATAIGANCNGMMQRGNIASALALSVVKKAYEEGSMVFFRFFAGAPDLLHRGKTKTDLLDVSRKIGLGDYNGGSTCISSALKTAFADIQQAQDAISKAEVLLITDAADELNEAEMRRLKKATKLNVLAIQAKGSGRDVLQKIAEKFYDVDGNNVLDFDKIAKQAVSNPV